MAQGSVEPPAVSGPSGPSGPSGSSGRAGPESGEARAAIYSVELDLFEGPLDLLLHLVRRHELDILDIPIAFVAEKYLEYLHLMRSLDLEIAGDYLVMAATLAWLKSRELLPQGPREGEQAGADDEEGEDPREALIRRLVEYERFKSAAAELDALPISGRDVFARGADIDVPPLDPGLAPVTLFRLAEAYYRVLTRAKINKTHDVTIELVTVAQRMQQLTLMLDERQEFDFEGLFLGRTWSSEHELRMMVVVTLMSVLELVKLGVARVQQVPDTDAIRVYRLVASEDARKILESYDEEQSFGAPTDAGAGPPAGPPPPTEAELDALEERTLLAEALAGLDGTEEPPEPADEIGVLAEVLDSQPLTQDVFVVIPDEADLGPEALAAPAANTAGAPVQETMSGADGVPSEPADMSEAPADANVTSRAPDEEAQEATRDPDAKDMSGVPDEDATRDPDAKDDMSGAPDEEAQEATRDPDAKDMSGVPEEDAKGREADDMFVEPDDLVSDPESAPGVTDTSGWTDEDVAGVTDSSSADPTDEEAP